MDAWHPDKKGELEHVPRRNGAVRVWRRNNGYLTHAGGYSSSSAKAQTFRGPGEAIAAAAAAGFAITAW